MDSRIVVLPVLRYVVARQAGEADPQVIIELADSKYAQVLAESIREEDQRREALMAEIPEKYRA